jgi:hypothetical protein
MGCGCKKKNNQTTEPTTQQTVGPETTQLPQTPTQEQIVQVAVTLRDMIEKKEL